MREVKGVGSVLNQLKMQRTCSMNEGTSGRTYAEVHQMSQKARQSFQDLHNSQMRCNDLYNSLKNGDDESPAINTYLAVHDDNMKDMERIMNSLRDLINAIEAND